jgi:cytochrome c-type biogenesis protein CcmH
MSVRTEPTTAVTWVERSRPVAMFVLALALLAAAGALTVVAVRGPRPSPALPDRVRAVASTLRCPVCQNLSVADSPSGLAQQMRDTIRRDLQAGRTPAQIRARFVASYGEWILLSPPRHGVGLAVWILPVLLMLGAVALGVVTVRRWSGAGGHGERPEAIERAATTDLSAADRALLTRALSAPEEEQRP